MKNTSEIQDKLLKYSEGNIEEMKRSFKDTLTHQRQIAFEDLKKLSQSKEAGIRNKLETQEKKIDILKQNFEFEMNKVDENHKKDLKRMVESQKVKEFEREKKHKLDSESMDLKYQGKIALIEDAHKGEIERLNKRHQLELNNLLSRVSNYEKKG
jgi:hypothetical protein